MNKHDYNGDQHPDDDRKILRGSIYDKKTQRRVYICFYCEQAFPADRNEKYRTRHDKKEQNFCCSAHKKWQKELWDALKTPKKAKKSKLIQKLNDVIQDGVDSGWKK